MTSAGPIRSAMCYDVLHERLCQAKGTRRCSRAAPESFCVSPTSQGRRDPGGARSTVPAGSPVGGGARGGRDRGGQSPRLVERPPVEAPSSLPASARAGPHNSSGGLPTLFESCRFTGGRVAGVGIINGNRQFDSEDFLDCTFEGNEFWFSDNLDPRSVIGVIETRRAVARRPHDAGHQAHVLDRLEVLAVAPDIAERAGIILPATLRTLDAIHLATALAAVPGIDAFVTYDDRLAAAARDLGLPVVSPV